MDIVLDRKRASAREGSKIEAQLCPSPGRPAVVLKGEMTRTRKILRPRVRDAEGLMKAIRTDAADEVIVAGPHGDQMDTLTGAEPPYRVMVDAMTDGAVMLSPDDTIFYSNQSFARLIGTSLDRVIGSPLAQFVYAEDRTQYRRLLEQARSGASRGTLRLAAASAVVPTHLSVGPSTSAGSPCSCVVVTDLSQRQRHEESQAAHMLERRKRADAEATRQCIERILEGITDVCFTLDRNWCISDVNQRAASIFGRSRAELIGKSFWDMTLRSHPDVDAQYRAVMEQRVAGHHEGPSIISRGLWVEKHIYPTDEGLAVYGRDITARKQVEEQLRQSDAHFNEAQRLGHIGSWVWNVRTGALVWSLEHYRLFGVVPDTFQPTKDNTQRFIHADDLTFVNAVLGDAVRSVREFEVEYRIVRNDGAIRFHRSLGRPLSSNGGDLKFVGTLMDVTDQKQAELALRESEECFRRAFELGLIGMAVTSPTRGILDVNDELCRILGYERDELLKITWAAVTHADDLAADLAQFTRVIAGEIDGYSLDKRLIRKNGRVVHSIMAVRCVRRADQSVEYCVGLVQDITSRHLGEERLRRSEALLAQGEEICGTGSWVLSLQTDELSWSREHYRLWGVAPDTFHLTLASARLLIHPLDRDAANEQLETAIRERAGFTIEFRIVRPDASVRHMRSIGRAVFKDSGDCDEYVGTVIDVTDRKAEALARQELRRRLIAAQEDERRRIALEMHDQFGQQLSHLVLKLAELRRDVGRRATLVADLESLEGIATQLDLDLEHIVGRLRPTALDDLGLVPALIEYLREWSTIFHVPAELHTSGTDADRLRSELETALYRIAQEALNNVAKHATAKHVSVLLDRRGDRVSIIVEDDGVGFDPEQPSSRFGVAGMRERARLLGGTLDIESRVGRGTTVVSRIPLISSENEVRHGQNQGPAG
jgi:PAS domain S-box-containing protein